MPSQRPVRDRDRRPFLCHGERVKPHHKGLLLTGAGVLIVSPDATFIRLIDVPALDLLFWRSAMMALVMGGVAVVVERGRARAYLLRFSWPVILAAGIYVAMNLFFIVGITHTTAANALVILAATPLFAALIGRFVLGERLAWFTWAASVGVVVLIGGIAGEALTGGGGTGVLAALGAALMLAAYFTVFRRFPDIPRQQVFIIAGAFGAVLCLSVATPFDFDSRQMSLTLVLAILILPAATFLMTLGPRYLPAAEVSLLILLESVFGPVWVFLVIGEIPSPTTMACGAAILLTVAWHAIMSDRRARRQAGGNSTS